ncbi:MAG: RNA-binding protein [Candidatus Marinimicrobia bacterium]|nr:RNA-binding protein [Candidatus Neomarinimicrobiota bacterium]MAV93178.1 RNA-binding protein [Candidatus Neomarinimicrobiota bacterium]MBS30475.1 RNA-binding protein [Candidatus Neomarinimicrobiota bacterium]|tara:strand:- start:18699 stop:18932 length:234 start_codon:yes stop_codon:yes gene_type:complete
MDKLLSDMVKAIVDKPDEVSVNVNESDSTKIYELAVGEGDLGKVIGKKGRNVNALRIILSAATAKEGDKRAILEVIE